MPILSFKLRGINDEIDSVQDNRLCCLVYREGDRHLASKRRCCEIRSSRKAYESELHGAAVDRVDRERLIRHDVFTFESSPCSVTLVIAAGGNVYAIGMVRRKRVYRRRIRRKFTPAERQATS